MTTLDPFQVRAAVMKTPDRTLANWGRRHGITPPQLSLALHNKRNDRRSREIRLLLAQLIGA
ncbi:MAG: hypothetical protein PHI35_09265 [Victivallaceae bacterium]|nr:hypothetical protein [Victivallaceae bacterium]